MGLFSALFIFSIFDFAFLAVFKGGWFLRIALTDLRTNGYEPELSGFTLDYFLHLLAEPS